MTVKGGPVAASDLAYRPDAFANGRSYVYAGRVVLADLAAFLASPNSWTPRRYADVLDLTEMDGVIGTTGSAFGKIVAGGFVGDVRDGVDGRSVCWAIRRADGEARGTLLVYPADTPEGMAEVAERGTEFAGQMMSFTDEVVLGASGRSYRALLPGHRSAMSTAPRWLTTTHPPGSTRGARRRVHEERLRGRDIP